MSALNSERDHMRRMGTAQHKPDCPSLVRPMFRPSLGNPTPRPTCDGCVTDAERDLWRRMADEIDAYLAETEAEDLFGGVSAEPSTTEGEDA